MKKKTTSLFAKLGLTGAKGAGKVAAEEPSTPVMITSYSQPHVLQQRMKEEGLTHGDRVIANLSPVRLESNFGRMIMYFCPMASVEVTKKIAAGDGGSLPPEAILENMKTPETLKPGLYTVKNVELFSNGTMRVIAGPKTEFVPV